MTKTEKKIFYILWAMILIFSRDYIRLTDRSLLTAGVNGDILRFFLACTCLLCVWDIWHFALSGVFKTKEDRGRRLWCALVSYFSQYSFFSVFLYGLISFFMAILGWGTAALKLMPALFLAGRLPSRDTAKATFYVLSAKLLTQIGLSLAGLAGDEVIDLHYWTGHSLGFYNPNNLGRVMVFTFLLAWYVWGKKGFRWSALSLAWGAAVFAVSGCRTAVLMLSLCAVINFFDFEKLLNYPFVRAFVRFFPLLCAGDSAALGYILAPFDNGSIDSNFICRFVELPYGVRDFGLSLFVRELPDTDRHYIWDNNYLRALMVGGVIVFVLFLMLLVLIQDSVVRRGNGRYAALSLMFLTYACMEAILLRPETYALLPAIFLCRSEGSPERIKKKDFYVYGGWNPSWIGGIFRYERNILRHADPLLKDSGITLTFLTPKGFDHGESYENIRIMRRGRIFRGPRLWEKLWHCLWKFIVYPVTVAFYGGCGVDLTLAFPVNSTGVYAIHDLIVEKYYGRPAGRVYAKNVFSAGLAASSRSAKLITVSEFSRREISEFYGRPIEDISVVGNGWEHIKDIKEDLSVFSKLGIAEGEPYCFALGSRNVHKNSAWIIKTAAKNPDLLFVVSGANAGGYSEPEDVPPNLLFSGLVGDGELKALMARCLVFLQPSFVEGFGIPPLEAMSLGRPVIVSDIPVFHEIYGDCARYIDPNGDGCLIEEVLAQPAESPGRVLSAYTWDNAARAFIDTLKGEQSF
ncbi:MAG: glycosyltransferase family 4 protein [Firmicutes bacterium]|nr:glycosyltransferase family 4 protein [Bacillota bacterium]